MIYVDQEWSLDLGHWIFFLLLCELLKNHFFIYLFTYSFIQYNYQASETNHAVFKTRGIQDSRLHVSHL